MVIENAERYGLSALHQLRGRVGRGAAESWCFLVSDNASESVQKRLKFLCSTSDGFAVAQYDLETVSYTHLDVYKRQGLKPSISGRARLTMTLMA